MKKTALFITFLMLIIFIQSDPLHAQGCSDAGFCSLEGLSHSTDAMPKHHFSTVFSQGSGDNEVNISNIYLEYKHGFTPAWALTGKLSLAYINGDLASTSGLGDLYISTDFLVGETTKIIGGIKVPLNDGNQKENDLSLPMDYQTSLGTLDAIIGVSKTYGQLDVMAALQQPLTQNNNGFLPQDYPLNSGALDYWPTNKFERSGDLLVRFAYHFSAGQKWRIIPSLLSIYHLQNDKYIDNRGEKEAIEGSQGLTLNLNAFVLYQINNTNNFEISFGMPLMVREARPDGLTRKFVFNLKYAYLF